MDEQSSSGQNRAPIAVTGTVALTFEERVAALEADRDRFLAALKGAAEMCLSNPMVIAMIPKQMKEDLKKYIHGPS